MVNEEIITALRNAVEHGESLQDAMQIMMNSGYSPIEVQEASKFVGGGAVYLQQPNPEEHLVMPSQKSRISNMAFWRNQKPVQQQPMQQPQMQQPQQFQTQQFQAQQRPTQRPMQQFPVQQSMQQQFQQQQTQQPPQLVQQPQIPIQFQQPKVEQFPVQQIPQSSPTQQSSLPLVKQLEKIKPPRRSYLKEIILLFILLILIGALIATIIYKDTILGWFS